MEHAARFHSLLTGFKMHCRMLEQGRQTQISVVGEGVATSFLKPVSPPPEEHSSLIRMKIYVNGTILKNNQARTS